MPVDDVTAETIALEAGVVALLHELDRRIRDLYLGRGGRLATLRLAFAVVDLAGLALELSRRTRESST